MKFTLNEVRGMTAGLDAILAKELPVKIAYWLARFLDKVSSEMKASETARIKLVEKLSKKDKDGKPIMKKDKDGKQLEPPQYDLTKENMEKFQTEFAELGKEEFEIDFKPIKLADLDTEACEKCGQKKFKIKPIVLVQLGKIIEE